MMVVKDVDMNDIVWWLSWSHASKYDLELDQMTYNWMIGGDLNDPYCRGMGGLPEICIKIHIN